MRLPRRALLAGSAAVAAHAGMSGAAAADEAAFPVILDGAPAPIWADENDFPGVLRAVRDLQSDLGARAGAEARLSTAGRPHGDVVIIVGTLGKNATIDRLVRDGKLDVAGVAGQWEAFVQQVVERPMFGVDSALVIAGADKRGAIYGIYDFAERIGISPWSWWADAPIRRTRNLAWTTPRNADRPVVRYRGIFINDENPALYNWVNEKFGGFGHAFYERVFQLILRLKGNYLWPAMWGKSLWDDDAATAPLADEMGVVLGTSHHEPLMRAHVEWERYGEASPWNYATNDARLREFWRGGMARAHGQEKIVTVGMRGDGDEPMTQGTAIALLERIVHDQREIIEQVTNRPAAETPQLWALYKEVQDYYDQGMQVPDDVTLLFADDNWGNIRRLPEPGRARPGGYGVYYHFDYVGGPRNYKWINTNQIERVWEQMTLAREYGADRIWIVNVGDLKPMEYPIDFFLELAWNPEAFPRERLLTFPRAWAAQQFGEEKADEIAALITGYAMFAARRKPELLGPETYSLTAFNEAEIVEAEWTGLLERAERVRAALPADCQSAYFQLVLHPIRALANLHALYFAVARNRLYAAQGRASANQQADLAEATFAHDSEITRQYHELNGGKWNHMMDQTHIGYTTWQQPAENIAPETQRLDVPAEAALGVAVEGDARAWPGAAGSPRLTGFGPFSQHGRAIEVFNRGAAPLHFTARANRPWIRLSQTEGDLGEDARIIVLIDWARAPYGDAEGEVAIAGAGSTVRVRVQINNPHDWAAPGGYIEENNYVAIEAAHFARVANTNGVRWLEIPLLGRTLSGVAAFPRATAAQTPGGDSPRLEYNVYLMRAGNVDIDVVMAPTLDFSGKGMRYAISVDDEAPQIVDIHEGDPAAWNAWVANNAITRTTRHAVAARGFHRVRLWLVDPGIVFERLVVRTGPVPQTYLGPPESPVR